MTKTVPALVVGLALMATGIQAQQTPTLGRASVNLGVPTRTHWEGCEKEDAEAKANGWNLAFGLGVYRTCDSHVIAPTQVTSVTPMYTAAAMREKIQGLVIVAAVIGTDGAVQDARVVQSLDTAFGLDAAAIDAVRRSTFTPGHRGANAVPVVVIIRQQFTLR